jgi:hypothetical protein
MRLATFPIKTASPDSEWLKFAESRGFTRGKGDPEYTGLKDRLLGMGGWAVCLPETEPNLEEILERGRVFSMRCTLLKGEPCRCHSNSALYWESNSSSSSICTGYALSKDGMWRQHTWVLRVEGRLVETTLRRLLYFGYVLSPKECQIFSAANF